LAKFPFQHISSAPQLADSPAGLNFPHRPAGRAFPPHKEMPTRGGFPVGFQARLTPPTSRLFRSLMKSSSAIPAFAGSSNAARQPLLRHDIFDRVQPAKDATAEIAEFKDFMKQSYAL
jgi:hypothetical protein